MSAMLTLFRTPYFRKEGGSRRTGFASISDVKIVLPGSGKLTWPNDVQTMVFTNPGVVQPPDEGVCAVDQDPAIPER
ncbi:hypothetical protein GLF_2373 [Gluconobacter frateurii NBRC 101659]|nr:hypothetical protein GLF_2373 [Gluconobacter frateurii NBRC 101659]